MLRTAHLRLAHVCGGVGGHGGAQDRHGEVVAASFARPTDLADELRDAGAR